MNTLLTRYAVTYAIALIGVGIFFVLGLPLPWLLGPVATLLVAALLGLPIAANSIIANFMRTILGVAVGATITTALLVNMIQIWTSLALVIVMIVVIGVIGLWYFHRLWKFDFATSYYGAMPGGLQDMLLFGEEAGGNIRSLSLIHATRVLVIVSALPFIIDHYWVVDLTRPPGAPVAQIAPSQLALMAFAGIAGWQIAARIGLFGASILGPLILAGVLSLFGLLHNRPPAEAIYMAQFFIGTAIGVKYVNLTLAELRHDVAAALGYTVILGLITAVFFGIAELLHLAPPLDALLAFAPGGQAEMTVLALVVGADLGFVITHHILRILVVILGAPLAAKWASRTKLAG